MDIVSIHSGLGNQMFQYAFYLSLKKQHRFVFYDNSLYLFVNAHNGYELDNVFNIKSSFRFRKLIYYSFYLLHSNKLSKRHKIVKLIFRILRINIILQNEEEPSVYKEKYLTLKQNASINIYWGYWQTPRFWENIKSEIISKYTFSIEKITEQTHFWLTRIKNVNSISIHIRRGDYLTYNILLDIKYYMNSISYIQDNVEEPCFFIFSDDIEWVKENIGDVLKKEYYILDVNTQINSWQDMFLMTQCSHNIIANSSFSWWGAYLNQNKDKIVIAPKKYYLNMLNTDMMPKEWLTI